MASIFTHTFDQVIRVRSSTNPEPWQALKIDLAEGGSVSLSLAEAQQLIADLSREVAVAEAEVREVAA